MANNSKLDPSPTYSPSHHDIDEWHRARQAPGNAPANSPAAPGNAPRENVERPEKSKDGR